MAVDVKKSLDDTIFSLAREDLARSKMWTDIDLACFEETSWSTCGGGEGDGPWQKSCHKVVLAAKSKSLGRLLRAHDHLEDVRVVFAGGFLGTEVQKIVDDIYAATEDVELWEVSGDYEEDEDDEAVKVKVELHEPQEAEDVKPAGDKGAAAYNDTQWDPVEDEYDLYSEEDDGSITSDSSGSYSEELPRKRKRARNNSGSGEDLSAKRVKEMISSGTEELELKDGRNDKFHNIYVDGRKTQFLSCKECSKVLKNNSYAVRRHSNNCGYWEAKKGEAAASCGVNAKKKDEGLGVNSFYLARLLKLNASNVELCGEEERPQQKGDIGDRFRPIKVDGAVVNFVFCLDCNTVLAYDRRHGGAKNLSEHDCKSRVLAKQEDCNVARDVLEELVFNKASEVTYSSYLESGCSSLLRRILHNEAPVPYAFCKICRDVVGDDELEMHECFTILIEVSNIFADEPNRIELVEEEIVSRMYPFLKPVLLDGEATGLVQCKSCAKFIRADSVRKEDRFSHRCFLGSKDERRQRRESFRSANLMRLEDRPNSFKCLLCNEILSSNKAEAHMRTIHGEGGKVLCSYCGKEFSRLSKARQHELHVHVLSQNAVQKFACSHCPLSFKMQSLLKRHMLGKHSGQTPFVCDVCGKAFKWNATLKAHVKIHDEKKVNCEFCEKKFISRGTYMHHRMTHTGEKPHVCPVCGMGFIKITACKIHAKRHHGVVIPKGISPKLFIENEMLKKQQNNGNVTPNAGVGVGDLIPQLHQHAAL